MLQSLHATTALDTTEAIRKARDRDELTLSIAAGAKALGFRTFHFGCHKRDREDLVLDPTACTHAPDFMKEYTRQGWNDRNPLLDRVVKVREYLHWSVSEDGSRRHRDYMDYLKHMGMQCGLIVPISVCGRLSALSLEAAERKQISVQTMYVASIIANAAIIKSEALGLCRSSILDESMSRRQLSPLQVEILKWASQGKSNPSIATILSLSTRCVNYHMSQILGKLGVATRAQAIVSFFCLSR